MASYRYYVVESTFVARVGEGTTERLTPDGRWIPCKDRWRVLTEGRELPGERAALEKARQLQERFRRRRERGDG